VKEFPARFGMRPWVPLLVFAVVALELAAFAARFAVLRRYHPLVHDQLVVYHAVYKAYFSAAGGDSLWTALTGPGQVLLFKGWLVPSLALAFMAILGPHRLSAGLVNFAFFLGGQVLVWRYLSARRGPVIALLGWGLFLLAGSHYFWAGGLDDLRLDYAGLVVFGAVFLALVSFLDAPGRRPFGLCLLAFAAALSTRSITMVYVIGLLFVLVAFSTLRAWRRPPEDPSRRLATDLVFLLLGALLEAGLFLLPAWSIFTAYYVGLKLGPRDLIRQTEAQVVSLADRLLYYPWSARPHFLLLLVVVATLAAYILMERLRRRPDRAPPSSTDPRSSDTRSLLLVLGAAMLAFYASVTVYSFSPVVISVLTLPVVVTLASALVDVSQRQVPPQRLRAVAALVAFLGLVNYTVSMLSPHPHLAPPFLRRAETVNTVHRDLQRLLPAPSGRLQILWLLIDPGLNGFAFDIYLYEHGAAALVPALQQSALSTFSIFSLSEVELRAMFDGADVVVARLELGPPPGFAYPFEESLRALESVWRARLSTEFSEAGRFPGAGVGLYVRGRPPG
jgi:hypothetical protein